MRDGRTALRLLAMLATLAVPARAADSAPASNSPSPDPALVDELVAANRVLYQQGVVDGFGHVSVRHGKDPDRFLLSRNMAPGLVTAADAAAVLDGQVGRAWELWKMTALDGGPG